MKLLLDTHALLWWLLDDARLSAKARKAIADPAALIFISAASAWELSVKHALGKLPEAGPVLAEFESLMEQAQFTELPITSRHARLAGELPGVHRDPFDRMLVAQSMTEQANLVTTDPQLKQLGAVTLW